MNGYFGYIRVSDPKQGKGVSLTEQKDAIANYARHQNLTITKWFEEQKTAAKGGRPVFNHMMQLLNKRKAAGVIIHKIDRSARNLKDWANLAELMDKGTDVHFAHESLDMSARGGRLAADLQAVVAADYIRNLREETKKGIYGRLKQGLYPFGAPIGYINSGGGQPKAIDPIKGPLVRELFTKYATGKYSQDKLVEYAKSVGLASINGVALGRNRISYILRNKFYIGLMEVRGQVYPGKHPALVSISLFEKVQNMLDGKLIDTPQVHSFTYRKLITCNLCNRTLSGEKQKGHVYYRCHTKDCPTKTIRENVVEQTLHHYLGLISLSPDEYRDVTPLIVSERSNYQAELTESKRALELQLNKTSDRLAKLTDAFIDEHITKEIFNDRNTKLLMQKKKFEEQLAAYESKKDSIHARVIGLFELLKSLKSLYIRANSEKKRDLLKSTTSNLIANGKTIEISMESPFHELVKRRFVRCGAPDCACLRKVPSENDNKAGPESNTPKMKFIPDLSVPPPQKRLGKRDLKSLVKTIYQLLQDDLE